VLDPPGTLEPPIGPATNHRQIKLPDVDTHGHAQALLSAGDLRPVHLVDARGTVCFATHGDDLLHVRLRDLNSFALAAYRGIPTSISIATTLRREGFPSTAQDSLPAAGQALPGGIGYPQGSNERFLSSSLVLLSQASWRNVSPFSVFFAGESRPRH